MHASGGVLLQSKTVKIDMIRTIARMLFNPSSGGTWWFLTVYILVVLLTPAIKEILLRKDKKAIKKMLFLVWVIEYVMGYMSENPYWRIQQGVFYYFVGGYLKLFWEQGTHGNTKTKRSILVCTLWSINAILQFKTGKIIALGNKTLYQSLFTILAGTISETILTFGCAVELFLIFKEMKIQSSTINCAAKTTFGIYLLHEIPFMRSILWNSIFRVDGSIWLTRWFVPYAFFCVFMVFFFCMFIDLARIKFFEARMIGLSRKIGSMIL